MPKEIKQKAFKISLIASGIFFLILFIVNWLEQSFFDGLLNGVIGGAIFGGVTFLISKSAIKNELHFKWWQWLFYLIGWLVGFANLLFWLIISGIYLANNYGEPFFNKDFHKRVYIWGIIITILLIVFIPFLLL